MEKSEASDIVGEAPKPAAPTALPIPINDTSNPRLLRSEPLLSLHSLSYTLYILHIGKSSQLYFKLSLEYITVSIITTLVQATTTPY